MMAKTATTRPRRKRKTARQEEYGSYVVPIADWHWSYDFGLGHERFDDEPYSEHGHLHLIGRVIRPTRIKAETVEVILMPDHALNRSERMKHKPVSVGSLRVWRGHAEALLGVPADALASVLPMLIAGRFQYVSMHGEVLYRGQATIRSYGLATDIDEEDMPT